MTEFGINGNVDFQVTVFAEKFKDDKSVNKLNVLKITAFDTF